MTHSTRYGAGEHYGDPGLVYGIPSPTGSLLWSVEVDWDRDNVFDGSNEADRMFSITYNRGRTAMLRQTGQGFESLAPGKCVIKLRNNDGRYDGWNTSSPLYPYVTYGADVRIQAALQTDWIMREEFYGTIFDIRPFGRGRDAYVELHIEDGGRFLRDFTARSPIVSGITPGTAIGSILDAVNWPTHWGRDIDSGIDTINYWWSSGNKTAWTELEDVAQSFLGLFFIKSNGQARFIDRSNTPVSVLDLTQEVLLKDIATPQPFVNRRNITRLKVHPRQLASSSVIYQLIGDTPLVEAGATKTIWGNYTYNGQSVPASNVLAPVATTDYTMNTNSDGSGTDKTADFTVSVYDFGDAVKILVRNNGASNAHVTKLQVKGDAIYEQNVTDVTYPEDPSLVTQPREFVLDQKWQQSVNTAIDYTVVLGDFLDQLHPFPVVKIEARPDIQLGLELFDVVNLDIPALGITGLSFRIGGIHAATTVDTCQTLVKTLYLEPYITAGTYWTWPVMDFGTDTIFGW